MGFFNNLLGNATELNLNDVASEFSNVLFEGEEVNVAFKIFRDKWVFTNKRLIMQDVQGVTGTKKEYHSVPYKSIYHFSVETAGNFDTDSELKIWIAGSATPLKKEMKRGVDLIGLQRVLAYYVCNK